MWGFWVVFHTVSSPVAPTKLARAARGSIALGMSRCWTMRSFTTTSAPANAASTSPPATFQWNAWLPSISSCSFGAPSAAAASGSVTAGSGS